MGCIGTQTHDLLHEMMICQPLDHMINKKALQSWCTDSFGCIQTFLLANNDSNQLYQLVRTLEVIKLQMAAELPAIVAHSIL